MKVYLPIVALAFIGNSVASFEPTRISYDVIENGDVAQASSTLLLETLMDVGMISITNIPDLHKTDVLEMIHECAVNDRSSITHTYPDGTVRHTLASSHSQKDGSNMQTLTSSDTDHCKKLEQSSLLFRERVAGVTQSFANHLTSLLSSNNEETFLVKEDGSEMHSLSQIVQEGEHLEHFHSYQFTPTVSGGQKKSEGTTIDWHTDQGIMLVFTPGVSDSQLSKGFFIQLKDGTQTEVVFSPEDELVILLGDGIRQIFHSELNSGQMLRATPHSFVMPHYSNERVWYGRMVLPPDTAIHPTHQITFGQLRNLMMKTDYGKSEGFSLGCSSSGMSAFQLEGRMLQHNGHNDTSPSCGENTSYCWHRCMNNTQTEEECEELSTEERRLELLCGRDDGYLWDANADEHGPQFAPRCIHRPDAADPEDPENTPNATADPDTSEQTSTEPSDSAAASFLFVTVLTLNTMLACIFSFSY